MAQLSTRYYVYWDHENCPTPLNSAIHNVIDIIKEKVMNTLGIQSLNFHSIKFYNNNGKTPLCKQITNDLDRLSYIDCPTVNNSKNESVDKKIIADIGYDLWECKGTHGMVIILISGDSDYSWLLSRIKTNISMATTILIPKFRSTEKIVSTLKDCCDHVIDDESLFVDKNKYALTLCRNGPNPSSTHLSKCRFYHKITYKQLLESKKSIDFLTKQAKIDLHDDPSLELAENDCRAIIEHFSQCKPSERLSVIYLVDSIVGKVGGVFTALFARHILRMMRVTYTAISAMDEKKKHILQWMKVRQLLQEWNRKKTFSPNLLQQIEKAFSISDIDATNQVSDHSDDESSSSYTSSAFSSSSDSDTDSSSDSDRDSSSSSDSDTDSSRIKCPNYQICKKSYKQKSEWYIKHVKECVKKS